MSVEQRRALAVLGLAGLAGLLAWRHPQPRGVMPAASGAAWDAGLASARQVDVNTADAAQLERLPGIGPALARRVIAERETHGPYARPQDLTRVQGIGPRTADALAPYLRTTRDE
jgi:competence protein ComEA